MSNIAKRGGSLPAVPTETATALQEASTRAMAAFAGATDGGGVLAALEVAEGIADLRALMDAPQIQARVKSLQDTAIGFRTDRGPGAKNRKTGEPLEPYSWPVVRDAVIEAGLRGLQLVGNQFNIISGRFYGTKEGFEYLIRKLPQVSDFRPVVGVPASRPGGVLIECTATWNQSGKPTEYKVTIPVKSDDYSTADQLIGKATRKLLARCYAIMTGNAVPEGDAADAVPVEATATTVSPRPTFRTPEPTATQPAPQDDGDVAPVAAPVETEAHKAIAAAIAAAGKTFDDFLTIAIRDKWEGAADWTGVVDIPQATAEKLAKASKGLTAALKGGAQ
jgi:hypothetical protein